MMCTHFSKHVQRYRQKFEYNSILARNKYVILWLMRLKTGVYYIMMKYLKRNIERSPLK